MISDDGVRRGGRGGAGVPCGDQQAGARHRSEVSRPAESIESVSDSSASFQDDVHQTRGSEDV